MDQLAIDEFADAFEEVIESLSTATDIHWLPYGDRWHLLVSILSGAPPVRGMSHPRDVPFNNHRRLTLRLANSLCRGIDHPLIRDGNRPAQYRFYDWLTAVRLLKLNDSQSDPNSPVYRDDIASLIKQLLLNFGVPGARHARRHWLYHRLFALLGLNNNERIRCDGNGLPDQATAQIVAAISNLPLSDVRTEDRLRHVVENCRVPESLIANLGSRRMTKLTIKTANVQQFIHRCHAGHLVRGASAWCSHFLTMIRDELLDELGLGKKLCGSQCVVLTDTDSQVQFVVDGHHSSGFVRRLLERSLHQLNGSGSRMFEQRFPMLAPYVEQVRQAGVFLTDAVPELHCDATPTTLLELATDGERFDPSYSDDGIDLVAVPRTPRGDHTPACRLRTGDVAVFSNPPPWHNSREHDAAETAASPRYGWPALLFAKMGSSLRLRVFQTLSREIGRPKQKMAFHFFTELFRDRLDSAEDDRVCVVALDGDRFGKMFLERSSLARPSQSVVIDNHLIGAWLESVKSATADREDEFLPVDLMYCGGDDLAFVGPKDVVDEILLHFSRLSAETFESLEFTAAVIEFSMRDDVESGRTLRHAAIANIHNAMRAAKGKLEHDALSAQFATHGCTTHCNLSQLGRLPRLLRVVLAQKTPPTDPNRSAVVSSHCPH